MNKYLFCLISLFAGCSPVLAEEELNVQPIIAGASLLVAPAPFTGGGLDLGHSWELEGFSYCATDIGYRIFPKELGFLSPILIGLGDFIYRSGEDLNNDLIRRKFACDLLGVVGRVSLEFKF